MGEITRYRHRPETLSGVSVRVRRKGEDGDDDDGGSAAVAAAESRRRRAWERKQAGVYAINIIYASAIRVDDICYLFNVHIGFQRRLSYRREQVLQRPFDPLSFWIGGRGKGGEKHARTHTRL